MNIEKYVKKNIILKTKGFINIIEGNLNIIRTNSREYLIENKKNEKKMCFFSSLFLCMRKKE